MLHWIIYALFIYLIYKFVKGFLFPAIRITNTMSGKMKDIQNKMNEMYQQQTQQQKHQDIPARKKEGEYIDYEEIK